MSTNPYHPGFGRSPSVLAGRDALIADVVDSLDGSGAGFGRLLVGDRGVGKTVLLNAIEGRARELGWAVVTRQIIRGSAVEGLLDALPDALEDSWGPRPKIRKLTAEVTVGINVGVAKVETKVSPKDTRAVSPAYALERNLTRIGEHCLEHRYGAGVLISLDEAHKLQPSEVEVLGSVMQVVIERRELPIVVLLAGLPDLIETLRAGGTFLERLERRQVGLLTAAQARTALTGAARTAGATVTPEAAALLADASGGYPYFVQIYGHATWDAAGGASTITAAHARAGIRGAAERIESLYAERWDSLPEGQQQYLSVMATFDEPASVADIARALDRTLQQLSPIRDRLIKDHHMIKAAGRGRLVFALPGFRAWLRASPSS